MWTRTRSSALGLALLLALAPALARADDDAMAPYRERFKAGFEKYRAGAYGEALSYWEPIYRELGPEQGYRLSWNLARAHEALGDATRAACDDAGYAPTPDVLASIATLLADLGERGLLLGGAP